MRCAVSCGCGAVCSRYRHSSPMYWNSVQSQPTMSLQNCRAEKWSRITTEPPPTSAAPVASTPPTLRYIGRQLYRRSLGCVSRSEEHTSELQSRFDLVCRLLLEKKTSLLGT